MLSEFAVNFPTLSALETQGVGGNKESVSAVFKLKEARFEFLGEASLAMFGLFAVGFPLASKENIVEIVAAAEVAEVLPENIKMMVATIQKVQNLMVKID